MEIQESKAEKGKTLFLVSPGVEYFTIPVIDIKDEDYLLVHVTNRFNLPDDNEEVMTAMSFMKTIVTRPTKISIKRVCQILFRMIELLIAQQNELLDDINSISLCVAYDEGVHNFIVGKLTFP